MQLDESTQDKDQDVPVTLADQSLINSFSRLNSRTEEQGAVIVRLRKEVEDLEEVQTEVELMDEEEVILCVYRWYCYD